MNSFGPPAALIALLCSFLAASGSKGAELTREPSVQLTTTNSAVLVWRTEGPSIPLVRFGTDYENLDHVVLPVQMTIRVAPNLVGAPPDLPRLKSAPPNTYQYEAHLQGLKPDTTYYYGIFDGEQRLTPMGVDYQLRAAPARDSERSLRFWVVGDSGDGSIVQKEAFDAMVELVTEEERPIDAYVHLGDMAYSSGTDPEFQDHYFEIYESLLRNTVTWPTMGNHEGRTSSGKTGVGPYYDAYVLPKAGEAGGEPSGTESYYSFDFGRIHFICLNSHDEARNEAGAMAAWLKRDLAQTDADWLIAFWHHPPYSKGTHDSDSEDQLIEMREVMVPLLEEHGVDLILAGHSHTYERSMLIDRAYETPSSSLGVVLDDGDGHPEGDGAYRKSANLNPHEGTVAVVAGHGRGGFAVGKSVLHRVTLGEAGSVIMDLDGDTLTLRMLNNKGVVRDEFQIVKRGEVSAREALRDPWNPHGPAIMATQRHPDRVDVAIVPRPLAEDAVIHYTTDGTEPTEESPIYDGPISVQQGFTFVQAFSIWRDGSRRSPVSAANVEGPWESAARVLRIPIQFSADDAVESRLGLVELEGAQLRTNGAEDRELFGLQFRDIPLPPNATILSAHLEVRGSNRNTREGEWRVHADLGLPTAPFSAAVDDLSTRTLSERSVTWLVNPWLFVRFRTEVERSPDLSLLIEEVLRQPGWEPGGSLAFLISGATKRSFFSFDGDPRRAPVLQVRYYEKSTLELAASVPLKLDIGEPIEGKPLWYLTFPRLLSAHNRSLSYQVEGSATMEPDSWVPVDAILDQFIVGAPEGFGTFRHLLKLPEGLEPGDAYFLRVVVTQQ